MTNDKLPMTNENINSENGQQIPDSGKVHKAGFVNILGRPNVGKSTLMNALVGEKLSATTHKAQTTRHRILGILSDEDYQIVFSDTPGIIKPAYKLQESMMNFVEGALEDADVFLLVTEPADRNPLPDKIVDNINKSGAPVILAINKVDKSDIDQINDASAHWLGVFPNARTIGLSALEKFNLDNLKRAIIEVLPENPPFFPKDELSDRNVRFFVTEMIREKILIHYKKEIPYAVEIVVDTYQEGPELDRMSVLIYVERESQKGIIIGPNGSALKRIATAARHDIEKFIGKKVFMEILVKVKKDWRDNESMLKQFGYES